jgi:hypothetical protein
MIIKLTELEVKQIIAKHIVNKGFDGIVADDVFYDLDEMCINVDIKDNVPYQPINYPLCPKCQGKSYPRCVSLSNQRYCTRIGGIC